MTRRPAIPARRDSLLRLAALGIHTPFGFWPDEVQAASSKPGRPRLPWTAREEQEAARQSAELIAEKTGEAPHPSIGEMLVFDAPLPLIDGQHFDARSGRHNLLLVFVWASWCPICKQLAPRLQQFWLAHRARGLELLSLSTDTDPALTKATASKYGYRFPIAMTQSVRLDPKFGIRSLPTLWVRSRRNVIVAAEEGNLERDDLKALLAHL